MAKIIVFVPLYEEMKYAYNAMTSRGASSNQMLDPKRKFYSFDYASGTREKLAIDFHVLGDMGNLRTAIQMAPWLRTGRPAFCFLVGIAGSTGSKRADAGDDPTSMLRAARIGDVVVSTSVKTYYPDKVRKIDKSKMAFVLPEDRAAVEDGKLALDSRKIFMKESFFRYRRDAIENDGSQASLADYLRHYQAAKENTLVLEPVTETTAPGILPAMVNPDPGLLTGSIFSSEMVIDSQEYLDFINHKNEDESMDYYGYTEGAVHDRRRWHEGHMPAVDMETLGFFEAVRAMTRDDTTRAFAVRGISDLASFKSDLEDVTQQARRIAVQNAIKITLDMIFYLPNRAYGA